VYPENQQVEKTAQSQFNLHRQVYNHALTQHYRPAPKHNKPSYTTLQNKLPKWKREWSEWSNTHSKALQMTIKRIYWAQDALDTLKERRYDVERLKWKSPREYRSITYNQSGFDVDSNTDRTEHARLNLSKIGDFNLEYHRELPENTTIKQVILKQETSGKWFASIVTDNEPDYPEPPDPENLSVEDTVGIDLGITKFTHDSDGIAITPPDVPDDFERIHKRHRALSGKEHGSNNWEKARRKLAEAYEHVRNTFKDFREKLAAAYTQAYNAVFFEDLNVQGLLELSSNGRNISLMSWFETIQTFKRHGRKNGCHVLKVPPEGTTKRCADCGVESRKPL
jgi:putative transposase